MLLHVMRTQPIVTIPHHKCSWYFPLIIITRAQYALGLCVCVRLYVCGCVCVWTKNTLVYVSPLEIRHKNALCCLFTEFIVLRRPLQRPERLDRAANRWFLIALWPSKSNIRHCGRIAQPKSRVRASARVRQY